MQKPIIYFLCTGNSCRSQIAEGFAHKYLGDEYEIHSAGIEAHGMNPRAVSIMRDADVDITGQQSSIIDPEILNHADYAITLCGDARDNCPVTPSDVIHLHWGFEDPAKAKGSEEEIYSAFRQVRDDIEKRIIQFKNEGK